MGTSSRAYIPAIMGPLRHGSYFDQWKIVVEDSRGGSALAEIAENPRAPLSCGLPRDYRAGGTAGGAPPQMPEIPESRRPAARRPTAPSAAAAQNPAGAMSLAPWLNRKFASAATISPRARKRLFCSREIRRPPPMPDFGSAGP